MNIHPTTVDYIIKESNATANNVGKESITTFNHDRKIYSIKKLFSIVLKFITTTTYL
jgi:hypothetical protein